MTDAELFDLLFEEHRGVLYSYLLGRAGEVTAAEDLLQETFVRAWRHIQALQEMCADRQRFWLLAVARNLAHDHHRRRTLRDRLSAPMPEEIPDASPGSDPARFYDEREQTAALDAAIRRLPEELRTVLVMQALEGLNSKEIGAALQRPPGTVRNLLWQARQRLAKDLADPDQNAEVRTEKPGPAGNGRSRDPRRFEQSPTSAAGQHR